MKEKLENLLKNSYSPYSKYAVAAILLTKDNKEFYGVNYENASYGSTICAERNAIGSAITAGYKKGDFKTLYLMVSSGDFATPCFSCRQVLSEFMNKEDKVISVNSQGKEQIYTIEELCPFPFSDEDLK